MLWSEFDREVDTMRAALSISEAPVMFSHSSARALVDGLRGNYAAAEAQVRRAELDPQLRVDRYAMATWQHGLGLAALAQDDHQRAFEHLRRVASPADLAYHFGMRYAVLGDLAEAARGVGRLGEIRTLLEGLLSDIAGTSSAGLSIAYRHARLMLAADDDDAEKHFTAALETDLTQWPLARARLLLSYGSWLRRRHQPVQAREPLRASRRLFDDLGIPGWGARARSELRATGEASAASKQPTWSTLTPQEWQIAQMAARGLTNQQIGEQLFISRRTVGSHLYHLFPKLRVTARSQLATALRAAEQSSVVQPGAG